MSITHLIECEQENDENDVRHSYQNKLECEVTVSRIEKTNIRNCNRNLKMFRVHINLTERVNEIIKKETIRRGYFYIEIVKLQNSFEIDPSQRAQLISNMLVLS